MRVTLVETLHFEAEPGVVFDFTNATENFTSFTGFGPIPGIREALYETPGNPRLGSVRRIVKTDGTAHREEITVFEPPVRHVSRITGIAPPFSWLVSSGEDDWLFAADGSGTLVTRRFSFELTTPLAVLIAAPLTHVFMRIAVRRDLRNIAAALRRR